MAGNVSVSVVIPAYNAEATLARALDSVLAQTQRAGEIIVVDDGSNDATADLALSYVGRGVRLLRVAERRGAAAARNLGVAAAEGCWIAFLDADDEWLPDKLEKQLAAVSSNSEVAFAFCASEEFSADGSPLGDTFRGWPVTAGKEAWKALLACNFVATPTVIARRRLLLQVGGFDETLRVAEDQDLWIRLALLAPIAYLPQSLVRVHIRPESLSSWRPGDQIGITLPMIERHLAALGDRLTPSERRVIRGVRFNKIGLIDCAHGDVLRGVRMLLRSSLLGYRPLRSVGTIVKISIRIALSKTRMIGGQRPTPY